MPAASERALRVDVQDAQRIFRAKCLDLELRWSEEREVRFVELMSEQCGDSFTFNLKENGLGPKAAAAIRIRLAQTQNIVAFAEMSNGDVYTTKQEVKVTIGGCGG